MAEKAQLLEDLHFDTVEQERVRCELIDLGYQRSEFYAEEKALEERKKALNGEIMDRMTRLGLTGSFGMPDNGTISLIESTRRSYTEERLKDSMIKHSILPEKIGRILADAVKESVSCYVQYRPPKNGNGKKK